MKELEQLFESFRPLTQCFITCLLGIVAQLGLITSIIALVVLLFQLRVVYYNGKLKRIQYDKECKGGPE